MADPSYAEWLQTPEKLVTATNAAQALIWGTLGLTDTASCALDSEAEALSEAGRQVDFKGRPLAEEQIVVPKFLEVSALRGRVVSVIIPEDATYATAVDVFVTGGAADQSTGVTRLDILRRL
jgi:hypothetical protein